MDALPNLNFKVELPDGKVVRAYTGGKVRMNKIKIIVGDKVEMIVPEQGEIYRITFRL